MKKFTPFLFLFITALFAGCTDNNEENVDTELLAQILGKWKLTQYVNDTPEIINYPDGPVMELKADGTFTSNEENGFTRGSFTVIKKPGANLILIFNKNWSAKQVYKRIDGVDATTLHTQASSNTPMSDDTASFEGYSWTKIP